MRTTYKLFKSNNLIEKIYNFREINLMINRNLLKIPECQSSLDDDKVTELVNLYQNKTPIYELVSGASIAFASLLLIIPGFFTDLIGFLLLIPFTRKILFKILINKRSVEGKDSKINKTIDGEIIDRDKDEL